MRFSWDVRTSAANLTDRGFDFAFATLMFDGPTLEKEDRRRDYGERRVVAIGLAQGIALTVVYTDRPTTDQETERRIILARRSNRHEREAFEEALS